MKVTFESANGIETEVLIKGEITSPDVAALLDYIKGLSTNTNKSLCFTEKTSSFL